MGFNGGNDIGSLPRLAKTSGHYSPRTTTDVGFLESISHLDCVYLIVTLWRRVYPSVAVVARTSADNIASQSISYLLVADDARQHNELATRIIDGHRYYLGTEWSVANRSLAGQLASAKFSTYIGQSINVWVYPRTRWIKRYIGPIKSCYAWTAAKCTYNNSANKLGINHSAARFLNTLAKPRIRSIRSTYPNVIWDKPLRSHCYLRCLTVADLTMLLISNYSIRAASVDSCTVAHLDSYSGNWSWLRHLRDSIKYGTHILPFWTGIAIKDHKCNQWVRANHLDCYPCWVPIRSGSKLNCANEARDGRNFRDEFLRLNQCPIIAIDAFLWSSNLTVHLSLIATYSSSLEYLIL